MGYVYMDDLVGSAPQSKLNPIGIYDGPRVGDEFREWNAMAGAGRKHRRLQQAIAAAASPGGPSAMLPAPGGDEDDAMGQTTFVDPPQDLDILYGMSGRKSRRWTAAQGQGGSPQPQDDDDAMGSGRAYGMGQMVNLTGAIASAAQKLAGDAVESIEFRSQVTPPVLINRPFAPGAPAQPQVQGGTPVSRAFMGIAKPAVYLRLTGGAVVPMEPYGKPVNDYTGLILLGTAATAAVGVFVGIKLGQKLFCKK